MDRHKSLEKKFIVSISQNYVTCHSNSWKQEKGSRKWEEIYWIICKALHHFCCGEEHPVSIMTVFLSYAMTAASFHFEVDILMLQVQELSVSNQWNTAVDREEITASNSPISVGRVGPEQPR